MTGAVSVQHYDATLVDGALKLLHIIIDQAVSPRRRELVQMIVSRELPAQQSGHRVAFVIDLREQRVHVKGLLLGEVYRAGNVLKEGRMGVKQITAVQMMNNETVILHLFDDVIEVPLRRSQHLGKLCSRVAVGNHGQKQVKHAPKGGARRL